MEDQCQSFAQPRLCGLFKPGHTPHWIQIGKAAEDRDDPPRVRSIHRPPLRDRSFVVEIDGVEFHVLNHVCERLVSAATLARGRDSIPAALGPAVGASRRTDVIAFCVVAFYSDDFVDVSRRATYVGRPSELLRTCRRVHRPPDVTRHCRLTRFSSKASVRYGAFSPASTRSERWFLGGGSGQRREVGVRARGIRGPIEIEQDPRRQRCYFRRQESARRVGLGARAHVGEHDEQFVRFLLVEGDETVVTSREFELDLARRLIDVLEAFDARADGDRSRRVVGDEVFRARPNPMLGGKVGVPR